MSSKYSDRRKLTQLDDEVAQLLIKQVQHEWTNEILYRNFYIWTKIRTLKGHSHYFNVRRKEEHWHRKWIYNYLIAANYEFTIPVIPEQTLTITGNTPKEQILSIHEAVLDREILTTEMLRNIAEKSLEKGDHATYQMIQKLVIEQIEEEDLSNEALDQFALSDDVLTIDEVVGKLI